MFSRGLTLVEGSPGEYVSSVGKAGASRTEGVVLAAARLRASVTLLPPGSPHSAAAGVHPEPSRHGLGAGVLIVREVTLLRADICVTKATKAASEDNLLFLKDKPLHIYVSLYTFSAG